MKLSTNLFLTLIIICVTLSACKKTTHEKTKTDYLTQKPWVLIAEHSKVSLQTEWFDILKSRSACSLDNIYTYTPDGSYITDEGAIKCSPTDEQSITRQWSWNTDTYSGVEYLRNEEHSLIIRQLDDNTLITEYSEIINSSTVVRLRATYGHR